MRAMSRPQAHSLRRLLLVHESAFLVLIVITGGLGGIWAYFWQQSSVDSVRINALLYDAQKLRGNLYRELKEVTRTRLQEDAGALDRYWNHLYHIDRDFNRLHQRARGDAELEAVRGMRRAYGLMQTEMNKVFANPRLPEALRIQLLDPAYEQLMLGSFEAAFQRFTDLIAKHSQDLEQEMHRWTIMAPVLIPVPILLALGLLVYSHRSLQHGFVRPMDQVTAGATRIRAGQLEAEIPVAGVQEVAELARTINTLSRDLAASRETLIQRERQAALGALVPVVAHNIRNPLASIRAVVQVADPDNPADVRESGEQVIATVDRLERWVSSLLSYLHPLKPHPVHTGLAAVADGAVSLLHPKLDEKAVRLTRRNWERDCPVSVDVDLLEQAVYGLLLNAVEASPPDSKVCLDVEADARGASLIIEDQGPGIPADVQPAALSPGPSTKRFGTGLGIPFAFKVCQAHGGRLDFSSAPGGGTRVKLTLPAHGTQVPV